MRKEGIEVPEKLMIISLMDMINHSSKFENCFQTFDKKDNVCKLIAKKDIKKGEEINFIYNSNPDLDK